MLHRARRGLTALIGAVFLIGCGRSLEDACYAKDCAWHWDYCDSRCIAYDSKGLCIDFGKCDAKYCDGMGVKRKEAQKHD